MPYNLIIIPIIRKMLIDLHILYSYLGSRPQFVCFHYSFPQYASFAILDETSPLILLEVAANCIIKSCAVEM